MLNKIWIYNNHGTVTKKILYINNNMSLINSSIDSSGNDFEHIKDNCLTNLKILSKIQQGDKLYYSNKKLK